MLNIDDLLGVPYKVNGTDKKGFDCKGFVLEVLARNGHKMDDLDVNSNMKKVTEPEEGDVILFYDGKGRVFHTGIYMKGGYFAQCNYLGVNIANLRNCKYFWEVFRCQN